MYINKYYKAIKDKKIVVNNLVLQEIERLIELQSTENITFDTTLSDTKIEIIERDFEFSNGSGKKFKLTLFQKMFIEAIYSYQYTFEVEVLRDEEFVKEFKTEDLFQEIYLEMARKMGKTELLAVLNILELMDKRNKNQTLINASLTLEQSNILFTAMRLIAQNSIYGEHFKFYKNSPKRAVFVPKNNTLTMMVSEEDKLQGQKVKNATVDEIHTIRDDISPVIKLGMKAQENPKAIYITTAGTTRDGMYDEFEKNIKRQFKNKELFSRMLKFVYKLEDVSEISNSDNWQKAMPNLGVTYSKEDVLEDVKKAKTSPKLKVQLLTTMFGIKQSANMSYFDMSHATKKEIPAEMLRDKRVIVGVDLAKVNDFACVSIVNYSDEKYYTHIIGMKADNNEQKLATYQKERYDLMIEQGDLTLSSQPVIDQKELVKLTCEYLRENELMPVMVAYDPWFAKTFIEEFGNEFPVDFIEVRQGGQTMAEPFKKIYNDLEVGNVYFESELLSDSIKNVVSRPDANGNLIPNKKNAGNKIDAFAAFFNAYIVMQREGFNDYDWVWN
jgi:phage terminase large subunit-like protein